MADILNELKGMLTSELMSGVAQKLGENPAGISKAMGGLLPTILGGMLKKSGDSHAFGSLFSMLADSKNAGFLDNLGGLVGGGNLAHGDPKDIAGGLMSNLFGNKVGGILDIVSNFAGIGKNSTSSLLGLAGPLVMGYLSKKIKGEGLSAGGLAALLGGQKSSILGALPAGMGNMIGLTDMGHGTAAAAKDDRGGMGWLPWVIGLAALGALLFAMRGCGEKPAVVETTADVAAPPAVPAAAPEAMPPVETAAPAGFLTRKLACGVELSVPGTGVESQLADFIEDANKAVDNTTWFNFDRLTFETGSATLDMAKSGEQLKNVAEMMKCYPNVSLKLGGYTDNVGNADANLKLSQNRADSVKNALVTLGVEVGRLEAEGYGDQHPVASNDTEEGRAQNRRISCRVSAK